ncbi:nuclear transport factor 2 family protein [Enterococcus sp. AZ109]|uniref:nuclear transport factor 2 family protein n=1 Tax=Enterococcus sp. AZ109 TaxID=2774634 RepID=UPI003F1F7484
MDASEVSSKIWQVLKDADRKALKELVHQEAVFVHMGITLSRNSEIDIVEQKCLVYQAIEFQEQTLKAFENIVILLNRIKLTAVVGGTKVINPFVVTEVYTKEATGLKLASMAYTRINY